MNKKMEQRIKYQTQISPVLKQMRVGDVVYYPISRYQSVQSSASICAAVLRCRFSVNRFTSLGYIQVTRTE